MKEWVFYSIYVPKAEYLENIIVNIVTPVVKQVKDSVQVHKWFFIRYIDMQGPHIRLRFLVNEDDIDIVEEITEEHLNGSLSKVLAEPLSEMSRLLPVKTDTRNFESGFQQEEYEPEYEKYGGIQGVNIAEDIFQSSSELVLSLLNDPVFKDSDRFDFALFLMKKTAEQASLSADQTQDLWESMLHYWSGADYTDGITYKTKLKEAAEKRIDVINVVLEKMYSNPFAIKSTNGYQKQLKSAFSQIQESDQIRISASHLSFHYIHMMNNRLGVWPIEEAYLGALLAQISKNTTDIK